MSVSDEEKEDRPHVHRVSLIKDREFYEISDLVTRYMMASQGGADCPHTDSPFSEAFENVAMAYYSTTPLPEHPLLMSNVLHLLETIAGVAFAAGVRWGHDGHVMDSERFSMYPVGDQHENHVWSEKSASVVNKWREGIRDRYYRPKKTMNEEMKRALATLLGREPDDDDSDFMIVSASQLAAMGIEVPQGDGKKSGELGTGLYL